MKQQAAGPSGKLLSVSCRSSRVNFNRRRRRCADHWLIGRMVSVVAKPQFVLRLITTPPHTLCFPLHRSEVQCSDFWIFTSLFPLPLFLFSSSRPQQNAAGALRCVTDRQRDFSSVVQCLQFSLFPPPHHHSVTPSHTHPTPADLPPPGMPPTSPASASCQPVQVSGPGRRSCGNNT